MQSGSIKGTFDDYVDGMHIQSLLKEMMIKEESEYYEVFTPEEKRQLLYVIFQLLVIGGSMNQPDEKIDDYLDLTKFLYKQLVW